MIRAQRTGPRVLRAEVYDAQLQAAEIVDSARADAAQLRAAAVEAGRVAGHAEAATQLLEIARLRDETLRDAEHELVSAVLLVAAELVGETLTAEPARISQLVAPHLARVRRAQHIVLKLHPADAHWLAPHTAELRQRVGLPGNIEVRADASISRGGCLVESSLGRIDARIETRLSELTRALGISTTQQETT